MKKIYLLVCALSVLFTNSVFSQAIPWQWRKTAGGSQNAGGNSISTDVNGNSYVTGTFTGTAHFDADSVTSFGGPDIYFAKYNSEGNCLWIRHGGSSTQTDAAFGAAVDHFGNCFFTGTCGPNPVFGSYALNAAGSENWYLVKCDSNGNILWAKVIQGFDAYHSSAATDALGNVYITGFSPWIGTFILDSYQVDGGESFAAKLDSNGNVVYFINLGLGDFRSSSIAVDASYSAYITGELESSVQIDSTTFNCNISNIFTLKINSSGNIAWARLISSNSECKGKGIATDNNGNVYVCSYFSLSTINFASEIFTAPIGYEVLIAKYDSSGNEIWGRQTTSTTNAGVINDDRTINPNPHVLCELSNVPTAIQVDQYDNIYMIGNSWVYTCAHFGSCATDTLSINSMFVMEYGSDGNCSFVYTSPEFEAGLSVDNSNSIYLTGSSSTSDMFIGKLSANPTDVSLINSDLSHFSAFPNPTSSSITLESSTTNLLDRVIVSGIDGRVIKSLAIGHSEKTTVDLKELSAGIYFLDCVGEKNSQEIKVVKY